MVRRRIKTALHALSLSIIKYGMLQMDPSKDIIFDLSKWSARSGNTGVYLMYAYARMMSILRNVDQPIESEQNFLNLENDPVERQLVIKLCQFWEVLHSSTYEHRPSLFCSYLYDVARSFTNWYETHSVKHCSDPQIQHTRIKIVQASSMVLYQGLNLLGIPAIDKM